VPVAFALALAFVAAAALSAAWLWLVARVTGCHVPTVDLLLIAGLCSALAPLPRAGLLLAIVIMWLLVAKATEAELWPDAVLMVAGSAAIWLFAMVPILNWALA
jgi:hypothetical protein